MKLMVILVGFAFIAHVKSHLFRQSEVNVEDLLYEEEDEEDDEAGASTTTTTTRRPRTRRSTTVPTTQIPVSTTPPSVIYTVMNVTGTNGTNGNQTFILTQTNNSFFGQNVVSAAGAGVTTERVHYVLGQVGRIWNNVGSLNITGIVDQSLGIRNHNFVRPLITGILNAVLCNPVTYSNNNCRKKGKVDESEIIKLNYTVPLNQTV